MQFRILILFQFFFKCIYLLRTLNLNPVMFKQTKKKEKKYRRDKERIIDKITD